MVSLTIYVISFLIIMAILGSVTVFLRRNTEDIDMKTSISSEYNKFNLYMLKFTKNEYNMVINGVNSVTFSKKSEDEENTTVETTETDTETTTTTTTTTPNSNENEVEFKYDSEKKCLKFADKLNDCEFKLCKNVNEFKIKEKTAENGKKVLETYIDIDGTVYTTDYVLE